MTSSCDQCVTDWWIEGHSPFHRWLVFNLFKDYSFCPKPHCRFLSASSWRKTRGMLSRHSGVRLSVCLHRCIVLSAVNKLIVTLFFEYLILKSSSYWVNEDFHIIDQCDFLGTTKTPNNRNSHLIIRLYVQLSKRHSVVELPTTHVCPVLCVLIQSFSL